MVQGALVADEPNVDPKASLRNATLRRAAKDQRQRARRLLVQDSAALSPKNLKHLREAEASRNMSDQLAKLGRSGDALLELVRSRALIAEVANDREERTEAAWLARTRDETIQLERARGEIVTVATGRIEKAGRPPRPHGQVRVESRDGLATLGKTFPVRLVDVGQRFRELYERSDPERSLGSQLAKFQAQNRAPERDPNYCPDTMRVHYSQTMKRVEAWIFQAGEDEGRHPGRGKLWLMLVREVAGKGVPINRLASGGSKRRRYSLALEDALQELAHYLGG